MMNLHSKLPKAGEIWAYNLNKDRLYSEQSLYVVSSVKDGTVTNRHILTGTLHNEQLVGFLTKHTFVF